MESALGPRALIGPYPGAGHLYWCGSREVGLKIVKCGVNYWIVKNRPFGVGNEVL